MTGSADRCATGPARSATALPRRIYGNLDAITDSERRPLRSIGATANDIAARTGALLTELLSLPAVRIFQGIRQAAADLPRIPHAVIAGPRLLLVESVAWPPGRYTSSADGGIHCDGVYIGQSVRPLIFAIQHWRAALSHGHQVSAIVVVHAAAEEIPDLPDPSDGDLVWTTARDAIRTIRACLPDGLPAISLRTVAVLLAATADDARAGDGQD
jgi:hypothetical protein